MRCGAWLCGILLAAIQCQAAPLSDAVILIIRHAEKPETGRELTPEGHAHAKWYTQYFQNFQVNGQPLKLDALFAARDSKNSRRPRLTLEPLAAALGLPLDTTFSDKDPSSIATELKAHPHGRGILICWHHGGMRELLRQLGADPDALLPKGAWPANQFGWVIELQYDHDGHILPQKCQRIVQPDYRERNSTSVKPS